jgi:hypothetical protein
MATLPIAAERITLVATGKVRPVAVYAEMADGSRKRVPDAQEKNDQGVPLWAVDVQLDDEDADRTEAIAVKVPALEQPEPPKWRPVEFTGLTCKPYMPNGGRQIQLSMRAEGISLPAAAAAAPKAAAKAAE